MGRDEIGWISAGITDKVRGNIERVEQEMDLLDPTLLPSIKAAESGETMGVESQQQEDDFAFSLTNEPEAGEKSTVKEEDLPQ